MLHMNFGAESKITHDEQKQNLGILQQNADNFAKTTINVDFYETQNRFSTLLPEHGYILDFGCGSRKRYKIFLEQGFYVDATDGSEEMCHIAGNYTGIQVRRLLFEELDENKNMMAYGPAHQYFIFLRMNLKPYL